MNRGNSEHWEFKRLVESLTSCINRKTGLLSTQSGKGRGVREEREYGEVPRYEQRGKVKAYVTTLT